ncbi:MAG: AsnC family transcriptional regulator [Actinomycetota bacterium]|nr:AsnC family transcriptional regulator [Actinomycetota bacterium]
MIEIVTKWSFLTNHGKALLCIVHDPEARLRDIAARLGITERRAYAIVSDLTDAGYVIKEKEGRRNRYLIQHHLPIPEIPERGQSIGDVLHVLAGSQLARGATKHQAVRRR